MFSVKASLENSLSKKIVDEAAFQDAGTQSQIDDTV